MLAVLSGRSLLPTVLLDSSEMDIVCIPFWGSELLWRPLVFGANLGGLGLTLKVE